MASRTSQLSRRRKPGWPLRGLAFSAARLISDVRRLNEAGVPIDTNTFWGTDYYKNPPLTDAMLIEAQRVLGVVLPERLVDLLRRQNGGYTRGFVFPTPRQTSWADDHVPLDELFGIGETDSPPGGHNMLDTASMTQEWGLPPKQILLAGDGHWWITLDYRRGAPPRVSWIDVEVNDDLVLAPSFDVFIDGLLPADVVDEETCTIKRR